MKKSASPPYVTFVPLIFMEIIVGSSLAALAFLLFADLSNRVLAQEVLVFDQTITQQLYVLRSPVLTPVMLFLSFLGGVWTLLIGSTTLILYLLWKNYRREAILFLFTFATGFTLNLILKYVIARTRPDIAPLIQEILFSYPSGHSMNAFVFYALLAYLTFHFTRNTVLTLGITGVCMILILLIGVSRVYLGVHYPSDVLAGFLAGAGWFLTVLVVERTLKAFWLYRRK
jgi:membrane-associated phospholipid phosphatase